MKCPSHEYQNNLTSYSHINLSTLIPNVIFTELLDVSMEHLRHASNEPHSFQTRGFVPFWDVHILSLLRQFSKICNDYPDFYHEYPWELSRSCSLSPYYISMGSSQSKLSCSTFALYSLQHFTIPTFKILAELKGQITISFDPSPLFGIQFLAIPFAFDFAFKMHIKEKSFKHSIN